MFDSHCHLDAAAFDPDRAEVAASAFAAGVTDILIAGVDPASWMRIRDLVGHPPTPGPILHAAYGLHPWALRSLPESEDQSLLDQLDALLETDRPAAVGECGLDTTIDVPISRQEDVSRRQMDLARTHGLPLVFHARGPGATGRLCDLVDAGGPLPAGGVIHSYSGGTGLLGRVLELGLCIGIGGAATWPRARKVADVVRAVPLDRLVIETDAPDQPPEGYRPGRNSPAYLPHIAREVARIRGIELEILAEAIARNARTLVERGESAR